MENLASTSLTYQILGCSIICTSPTRRYRECPSPSPCKQCWDEGTLKDRLKRTGLYKLGRGRGEGGESKVLRVVLRLCSPIEDHTFIQLDEIRLSNWLRAI